ncbi:protein-L-isoaspartate O-methyltransferase [Candidatus Pacearchaeota archaeon]|nr:protein-L-isoaspartate O-methyltransferase [Candidatus Pacearchaeota archaeon]
MNKTQLLQSLKQKGFSKKVLDSFSKVSREKFIPAKLKKHAYEDIALPIGRGQTISQPYTIAMMLSLLELKNGQKVLEIGSGCGYVFALISKITKAKVFGIEIVRELAEKSKENLKEYNNIEVYNRDGSKGLAEESPYDRIIISAAGKEIPKKLVSQLKNNGIIVAPVGPRDGQSLIAFKKIKDKLVIKKEIPGFVFVPFI